MPSLHWFDHALVAFFAFFSIYAATIGRAKLHAATFDRAARIMFFWSNGIVLFAAGGVTCLIWTLGDRSLASLGLTLHQDHVLIGLALSFAFIICMGVDTYLDVCTPERRARLLERWRRDAAFLPNDRSELPHFGFIALAAGINEEIIARGYLILYLLALLGDSTIGQIIAVSAPAAGFALVHVYQDRRAVLRIFIMAAIFGSVFLITGSLLIPILLHFAVDLFAGMLAIRLARSEQPQQAVGA